MWASRYQKRLSKYPQSTKGWTEQLRDGARFSELGGPGQVAVDLPPPPTCPRFSSIQKARICANLMGRLVEDWGVRTHGPPRPPPGPFLTELNTAAVMYTGSRQAVRVQVRLCRSGAGDAAASPDCRPDCRVQIPHPGL